MSTVVSSSADLAAVPAGLEVPWAFGGPGTISRLAHGAYHLPGHPVEAWMADLAEACARVPGAVIGLGSAAYFDLLVDAPPAAPCLLVPRRVRVDAAAEAGCRIIEIDRSLDLPGDVILDSIAGVPVRRTTAVRTLIDLARHDFHPDQEAVLIEACRRLRDMSSGVDTLDRSSLPQGVLSRMAGSIDQSGQTRS